MFTPFKLPSAFIPMRSALWPDSDMGLNGSHPTRRRAVFSPLNIYNTTDMKTGVGFLLMLSLRGKYGS